MRKAVIPNDIVLSTNSFYNVFSGMNYLNTIQIEHPAITNISYMCYNSNSLVNLNISMNNVINMSRVCRNCYQLKQIVCGPNVINMSNAYQNCYSLTGNPVCGNNVTDMSSTYYNCYNLTGSPVCGNNVINMSNAYRYCHNLTGNPVCRNNVTTMAHTYINCYSLTGNPVCGNNLANMAYTYYNCYNLKGNPVCGNNVISMAYTYYNCRNLTGNPACGNNVTSMAYTYEDCRNLTGSPVCGPNVINMHSTYEDCRNLTGSPVCGPNVTSMYSTYDGCRNLTGNIVFSNKVINIGYTYYDCNQFLDQYIQLYSNEVNKVCRCFYDKNNFTPYMIYSFQNTNTWNTLKISDENDSIVGDTINWTNTNTGFYNTTYGLFICSTNGPKSIINFTIDNIQYQAEEGMTWKDWINSNYNTNNFTIENNYIKKNSKRLALIDDYVLITNPIGNDLPYIMISSITELVENLEIIINEDQLNTSFTTITLDSSANEIDYEHGLETFMNHANYTIGNNYVSVQTKNAYDNTLTYLDGTITVNMKSGRKIRINDFVNYIAIENINLSLTGSIYEPNYGYYRYYMYGPSEDIFLGTKNFTNNNIDSYEFIVGGGGDPRYSSRCACTYTLTFNSFKITSLSGVTETIPIIITYMDINE